MTKDTDHSLTKPCLTVRSYDLISYIHSCFSTLWFSVSLHHITLFHIWITLTFLTYLKASLSSLLVCVCFTPCDCIVSVTATWAMLREDFLLSTACHVPDYSIPLTSLSQSLSPAHFWGKKASQEKSEFIVVNSVFFESKRLTFFSWLRNNDQKFA